MVLTAAPSEDDVAFWTATLRVLSPLTVEEIDAARRSLRIVDLAAGQPFLRVGERADRVAVVRRGVVRESFERASGEDRTRGFGVAGDFAGSLSDLLRGEPARTGVLAVTDATLVVLQWERVLSLVSDFAGWRDLLHRATETLYLLKADREYELLALDAEERYARFRARYPGLEAHVTQRHVASYVGITPEHLSRLRARAR